MAEKSKPVIVAESVVFHRHLKPGQDIRVEYDRRQKRLVLLIVERRILQAGTDGAAQVDY